MGIFRTILAIAVVVYHSYKIFGLRLCGGQVAVESFYIISGFYMALILNEKYIGTGNYKRFILSRFFRIFPTYWLILLLAIIVSLVGYIGFDKPYYLARYISYGDCLSPFAIAYFIIENIVIIGQDAFYFLHIDEVCTLKFTKDVLSYKHTAFQYLMVPQAWSISIECIFYLIAPFLVTQKIRWQFIMMTIFLIAKWYFSQVQYLFYDPWTYRFFPFELPFFMAGSLAYQYYKQITQKAVSKNIGYFLLLACIIGVVFIEEIPIMDSVKYSIFYLLALCSIPFIFLSFKDNKIDRFIGELSFSIYISHHLLVSILRGYFFSKPLLIPYYGYVVVISSIILAIILQLMVINRFESYRAKRFS